MKIAFRNLIRHKAFSIINITGLAIGIASCLLLFTVVKYELSYDKFQPNYKHVYHVATKDKTQDGIFYTPGVPFPTLEALRLDFPQITSGALLANYGSQVTVLGENASNANPDKKFIEKTGFFFCDPQFFKVFNYEWISGSPSVLNEPNVTVLTQKIANKYFGDWKNAMGQYLKLDNAVTVKVAGILKDVPVNTDFPLAIVTSYETVRANDGVYFYSKEWGATTSNFQVFMLLPKNISADKINTQLLAFSEKHFGDRKRSQRTNFLQPLSDVHFDQRFENFGDHVTAMSTLWTLSLIGIFIIIMACINFINLSTAQAVGRSKEIGIRKVLGSYRWQLFFQVIGETAIIVFISVLLALIIAILCLPFIKHIASIQESLGFFNLQTILFVLLLMGTVTILAGLYPALVLSGFNPALALKNKITSATVGGISLRRGLVITQFAISQILIVGTIVAITQMNFIRNADLGFSKEALLIINANTDSVAYSRQPSYKEKLLKIPGVKSVSFSSDVPSSDNNSATNFGFDHKPDPEFSLYTKFADEDYFKTFGLQILAGRPFSKADTINEVVVNETLVKKLNVKSADDMIGKQIRFGGGEWKTITGVVKDFKTNSLKENIKPLAIAENRENYQVTSVKLMSANIKKAKADVEAAWNNSYPEYAFTSTYMDENIADFYKQDEQLSLLYKIFAGIAIFISCLGLYGLVSFMAVQRTKEIGIRKVLGASVQNIIYLFSKEFTILIFAGSLVAVPVAWYMMSNWLQNFVFGIKMNWAVFAIAIVFSIVVAWLAVGYKSIKAAMANPVKSLRSE
ncbi:MAG TPA: ABC transporter permease [Chitinophagaceae bacterium]|nr:ABC transporter permease [Chitinophagaceae bacterium]